MTARSQSLAAAFAAQTWTVPVLPQRRHFLGYTHIHTHTPHESCSFPLKMDFFQLETQQKLGSAHQNTRSCCTGGRCWVLQRRTKNLPLNNNFSYNNKSLQFRANPTFFPWHLFLLHVFLTLDRSSCGGPFLLLLVPAGFHRNGSRGLVDRIVIHIGTGSADVHTLFEIQKC